MITSSEVPWHCLCSGVFLSSTSGPWSLTRMIKTGSEADRNSLQSRMFYGTEAIWCGLISTVEPKHQIITLLRLAQLTTVAKYCKSDIFVFLVFFCTKSHFLGTPINCIEIWAMKTWSLKCVFYLNQSNIVTVIITIGTTCTVLKALNGHTECLMELLLGILHIKFGILHTSDSDTCSDLERFGLFQTWWRR